MTTDDFTRAARAYAEQACYQDENRPIAEAGFRAGWKAARSYLISREEAMVRSLAVASTHTGQDLVEAARIMRAVAQEPTDAERAVRDLHRQYRVYELEDACPDTTDEHRESHHHEDSDSYGEFYCDQLPLYALCDHCRDESGERLDWPCATIQALDSARAARRDEEKR